MLQYGRGLKKIAQCLRGNMTIAELVLWSKLKREQVKGCQFYRQKSIENYIVDFYCPAAKLVIEVDGGQHYSDEGRLKDIARDNRLNELGLEVLRFSDTDVLKNTAAVLEVILQKMNL